MRVHARITSLERKQSELKLDCAYCRKRPAEIWRTLKGQTLPPSVEPPCPVCGKRPKRINVTIAGSDDIDPMTGRKMPYRKQRSEEGPCDEDP